MTVLIENIRLMQPGEGVAGQSLLIDGATIQAIDPADVPAEANRIDGGGRLVTPGLVDIHTHGYRHDSYDADPIRLAEIVSGIQATGVTSVLATVVPSDEDTFFEHLRAMVAAIDDNDLGRQVGLHLEGPFVALSGAACKTRSGDVDLMARYADACGGTLRAVSIAPEVENIIPVIEWLAERGVAVFITHTQADFDQTARAIDAGARHATHFYDVFYNPEPTDGGARPASSVEAILGDTRCTVDFIPDGVHVHPGVIRMAQTIKGPTGVCAITDSNIGAGLPDGVYPAPWGFPIEVGPRGGARNADPEHPHYGCLAGSVLQLDQAVNNLFDWLDQDDALTWAMATSNPAAVAHLENKGRLAPGGDADLVLWDCHDGRYQPAQTWVAGQRVWQSESVPG